MSHPSFWNDSILLMKVIVWFLIGGKTVSKCNFYLAPEFCISWIKYRQNLKKQVSDNINKKSNTPRGFLECLLEYRLSKRNYTHISFKSSEFDTPDIFEIEDEVKSLITADRCINIENPPYIESAREMSTYLNSSHTRTKTNCMNCTTLQKMIKYGIKISWQALTQRQNYLIHIQSVYQMKSYMWRLYNIRISVSWQQDLRRFDERLAVIMETRSRLFYGRLTPVVRHKSCTLMGKPMTWGSSILM